MLPACLWMRKVTSAGYYYYITAAGSEGPESRGLCRRQDARFRAKEKKTQAKMQKRPSDGQRA